jgi:hypothetical protein
MDKFADLPENRELTTAEYELVRWLLEQGYESAGTFLPQLEKAKVVSRCSCGCASVNFSIGGKTSSETGMQILSDYQWSSAVGYLLGIFLFAKGELLSGLEVWSIDGQSIPDTLPSIEELRPIGTEPSIATNEPDSLMNNLVDSNGAFRELLKASKESHRKPFPPSGDS